MGNSMGKLVLFSMMSGKVTSGMGLRLLRVDSRIDL
jgi:hypothetical protein